jgi:hypothetical protein
LPNCYAKWISGYKLPLELTRLNISNGKHDYQYNFKQNYGERRYSDLTKDMDYGLAIINLKLAMYDEKRVVSSAYMSYPEQSSSISSSSSSYTSTYNATPTSYSTNKIGNTYFHSNGTSTTKIGNTYFHSDGTSTNKIGNTYFNSNGTSTNKIGNTYFHSDGTSTNKIGNTYFNSDGSSTTKIGNTYFHNGY